MEWAQKNKKLVAIGAGLVSVLGLGAYFLLKDEENNEVKEQPGQQQSAQNTSNNNTNVSITKVSPSSNSNNYQVKLQSAVKNIQVTKEGQNIDFQTIARILESSVEVFADDFVQITQVQRAERRSKEGEEYQQLITKQSDETEQALNKVQEDIIAELGISQQEFENSLMMIIQRGLQQQLIYLDMAVKQQLKIKIHSDKGLDVAKAKEIIRYQNEVIENEPEYFEGVLIKLVSSPDSYQKLPQIINIMLCDKVYEKYQIEEEDIVNMLGPHAQTDPEIHQLMQKAEESMRNLLQKIIPNPYGGMGGGMM